MTARQLMRFYPRAWRARYGDEFVDVVGEKRLSMQQVIDIVGGAIDAWTSPAVRASVRGSAAGGNGGETMIQALKLKCAGSAPRYTTRDGMISAGMMLLTSAIIAVIGMTAKRQNHDQVAAFLLSMSFPASLVISMPFLYLKGQSRTVKTVFVGGMLAILTAITILGIVF